ncbi:MAG: DegQ family serine endoprotease [Alphaproteobacteria bacterium]
MNRSVSSVMPDGRMLHRVLFLVVAATLAFGAGNSWARPAPDSFADLAAKLLPAVVNISTTQAVKRGEAAPQLPRLPPGSPFEEFFKEFFDRQQRQNPPNRRSTSLGSGFVIDSSGLVVTNNHVIAGADEITVIFHDNVRLKAEIVGRDAKTDLAVLRVKSAKPLTSVTFGDSDKSRVGDWVLAIGNPFGLGGTVTAGIISARARNINAGPYDDFIQTDASINRGNSGGPMFDVEGKVIGINTAIFSPTGGSVGIGFSIPSNLAKPLIDQLIKFGRARRGWLGVRIQTVTEELADSLGLDRAQGALVANITPGGPAEKGKIKVGDVILKFDGKPIHEMRTLPRVVAETAVGKSVQVVVWRLGSEVRLTASLGEFPEEEKVAAVGSPPKPRVGDTTVIKPLGLTLSKLDRELRGKFKLAATVKGVVVTAVADGSPSAEKGVRPGDIVRRIGSSQDEVTSPGQVSKTISSARKAKRKTVLFLFERAGNSRFVALGIGKS